MRAADFIAQKREGNEHSLEDLEAFVTGFTRGEVTDYQAAAWLMAVCWRGMSAPETAHLTQVMAASGDTLDLSNLPHTVDKHSTGGVGDKTSLVLAPLLAVCGATVAKMSGRGLGHTGGTVDKLESIPGFRAVLSEHEFLAQARAVGVVISGQSKDLAPADGLLYALRDATATVASLPLIASSIMSKKLASGAESIVLDVKVGSGAFMKTLDEARALAEAMVDIGNRAGRRTRAVISSMREPLGHAVGHALEVQEAVRCLKGEGPEDLEGLCVTLAAEVLSASGLNGSHKNIAKKLSNGEAFEKFETWIAAQGGEVARLRRLGGLELAAEQHQIRASQNGYVREVEALKVGEAVKVLGGGRSRKGDAVDLGVGVVLHAKIGDEVEAGEPLVTVYHNTKGLEEAVRLLEGAFTLSDEPVEAPPLVLETLA